MRTHPRVAGTPHVLRTADLDYPLPEELIATTPVEPRDSARLLVVSRTDTSRLEHRTIRDLAEILRPSATRDAMPPDLMVVNATRVLPARFKGIRTDTRGQVEGLYLGPASSPPHPSTPPRWTVLLKMRRAKPGARVMLYDHDGQESGIALTLIDRTIEDNGSWIVEAAWSGQPPAPDAASSLDLLNAIGLTPVPPYILASRKKSQLSIPDTRDRAAYQTVYAAAKPIEGHGSVAAPTAGLHFTPSLLAQLESAGVHREEVSLDVGLGTFKPVETEFVEQHPMHAEWCHVPRQTAEAIRNRTGRLIAIGTTAARTLESFETPEEMLRTDTKETRLLITPGYHFKHIEALLTNFHLPESTLLALVAAFLAPDGSDPAAAIARLKHIYAEAIRERYRFYSFGDAMLILP